MSSQPDWATLQKATEIVTDAFFSNDVNSAINAALGSLRTISEEVTSGEEGRQPKTDSLPPVHTR